MSETFMRLKAVIDLDAVKYNIRQMRANIRQETKMIVVIKTDGYGHGAVPIARLLEPEDYVWGYAVATLEEALELRNAQITKPVLCLGCIFPDQMEEMLRHDIRMTTYTYELAKEVSDRALACGKDALLHIKLDTGMSRLGFPVSEESAETIERIARLPHVKLEGMFTHFARADETDKTSAMGQMDAYLRMKEMLLARGVKMEYYHCSNSAGIIDIPEANMDLVRAGISTYGLYPSGEVSKTAVDLRPAMRLVSHVTHVKWIEAGTPVSYGGTFVAEKRMRVATVPAGYGDGYPRSLSNKGYVLIHGKKAPVLGRVCMDQFMADVTEIPETMFGDEVVLVGTSGGETITVEELGELSGRFNYEFVCDINKRVPRE